MTRLCLLSGEGLGGWVAQLCPGSAGKAGAFVVPAPGARMGPAGWMQDQNWGELSLDQASQERRVFVKPP